MRKLQSRESTIKDLTTKEEPKYKLYIPTRARYFIPASPEDLQRNNQMVLGFSNIIDYKYAFILISGNVFYWYWRVYGDGFDVAAREVLNFPCPTKTPDVHEIEALANELESAIPECRVYKLNAGKMIPNINFNKRIDILLKIDKWIVETIAPNLEIPIEIFAQKKSNSFMQDYQLLINGDDSEEDSS